MPKKTQEQILAEQKEKLEKEKHAAIIAAYAGKYEPFNTSIALHKGVTVLKGQLDALDPALSKKLNDAFVDWHASFDIAEESTPILRNDKFSVDLNRQDANIEYENKLVEIKNQGVAKVRELVKGLKGTGLEFKDYFEAELSMLDPTKGDYTRALADNQFLGGLTSLITGGPKLVTKKNGDKIEIDFDKTKENLGAAFVPLMNMYKDYNTMLSLEYEKQALEDAPYNAEKDADFRARYKEALDKTARDFKALRRVEVENRHKYGKDVLNNSLDEMVAVSSKEFRDIGVSVANMEGQSKAIENGWGTDELHFLGWVNELDEYFAHLARYTDDELGKERIALNRNLERQQQLEAENQRLLRLVNKDEGAIYNLENANKQTIEDYADYLADLNAMKKAGRSEKEIKKFTDSHQDLEDRHRGYLSAKNQLLHTKEFEAIEEELNELKKKEPGLRSKVTKNTDYKNAIDVVAADAKALKDGLWNKKVKTVVDKREALSKLESFMEKNGNTMTIGGAPVSSKFESYKNQLDVFKKELTSGNVEKYGPAMSSFHMNKFYGSKPVYMENWDASGVYKKDAFTNAFPPYDTKELPFNELEITALGMGSSVSANNPLAVNAFKAGRFGDIEGSVKYNLADKWNFWNIDMNYTDQGPRPNICSFEDNIKAGREGAKSAMEAYVKGDRKPLAECIYSGMYTIQLTQSRGDEAVGSYASTFAVILDAYADMLKRDPKLAEELKALNEKQPEKEKIDFKELDRSRMLCKARLEARNAESIFKKKTDEETLGRDEAEYLTIKSAKGGFFAHLSKIYNKTLKNMPEYLVDAEKERADLTKQLGKGNANIDNIQEQIVRIEARFEDQGNVMAQLCTPEGQKKLNDFSAMMVSKYGMKIGDTDSSGFKYRDEMNREERRFAYELENDYIISKLEKGGLSEEETKKMVADYVMNNHYMQALEKQLANGELKSFTDVTVKNTASSKAVLDKRLLFRDEVKAYTDSFNIKGASSEEIATLLKTQKNEFFKVTEQIEAYTGIESYKNEIAKENNIYTKTYDRLDRSANKLSQNEHLTGSKEYTKIFKDYTKLIADIKKADADYARTGTKDTAGLIKREKELCDRMKAYISRKEKEIKTSEKTLQAAVDRKLPPLTDDQKKGMDQKQIEDYEKSRDDLFKAQRSKYVNTNWDDRKAAMNFAESSLGQRLSIEYETPDLTKETVAMRKEYLNSEIKKIYIDGTKEVREEIAAEKAAKEANAHPEVQPVVQNPEVIPVVQNPVVNNINNEANNNIIIEEKQPEVKEENINIINENNNIINEEKKPVVNGDKKKPLDALNELQTKEAELRNGTLGTDFSQINHIQTKEKVMDSAYRSLYLEVLKDDYLKKPTIPKELAEKNDKELRKALVNGFKDKENIKAFETIGNSVFGEAFEKNVIKAYGGNKQLNHEDLLKIRDDSLVEAFTNAGNKYKNAKANGNNSDTFKVQAGDAIRIANALGSKALEGKGKSLNAMGHTERVVKIKTEFAAGKK